MKEKIKIIIETADGISAVFNPLFDNKEAIVNQIIKDNKVDTNLISDGYHTFKDLYDHRIELFIQMSKFVHEWEEEHGSGDNPVWMADKDSEGNWDKDWFILGINKEVGEQITYHLPIERWDECSKFAKVLDNAPAWDGHTSKDVLERLKRVI